MQKKKMRKRRRRPKRGILICVFMCARFYFWLNVLKILLLFNIRKRPTPKTNHNKRIHIERKKTHHNNCKLIQKFRMSSIFTVYAYTSRQREVGLCFVSGVFFVKILVHFYNKMIMFFYHSFRYKITALNSKCQFIRVNKFSINRILIIASNWFFFRGGMTVKLHIQYFWLAHGVIWNYGSFLCCCHSNLLIFFCRAIKYTFWVKKNDGDDDGLKVVAWLQLNSCVTITMSVCV